MNIHKAIQVCRCRHGLSQRDLGKAIGNDASQISQLESGNRTPGLKTLERICKVLDLPLVALVLVAMEPTELWDLDNSIVQVMDEVYIRLNVEAK